MCDYRDGEMIEGKLEDLEKEIEVNQVLQDFVDEKMQKQLDLLESKIAELEEKLGKAGKEEDSASKPQQKRLVKF